MNSDQFEGKWKQLKGSVKQQWGRLTDDDLTAIGGKKDELIGWRRERYGYAGSGSRDSASIVDDKRYALSAENGAGLLLVCKSRARS